MVMSVSHAAYTCLATEQCDLAGVDDTDFAKKLTDLYREGLSDKKIAERMQVERINIRLIEFCCNSAQTDDLSCPSENSLLLCDVQGQSHYYVHRPAFLTHLHRNT